MSILPSPALLIALVVNVLITAAYLSGMTALGKENGILENAQVLLLFMAFVVAVVKWHPQNHDRYRYIIWGVGLLAISFFLRELDLRRTDLNSWLIYFTSEKGRTWLTVLLWLPFLAFTARRFRWVLEIAGTFMRTHSFWLFMVAAISLLGGALFDKSIIVTEHKYFMEEIFELNGYAIYLYATILMNQLELKRHCSSSEQHEAMG